jgi:hypothetical protein
MKKSLFEDAKKTVFFGEDVKESVFEEIDLTS